MTPSGSRQRYSLYFIPAVGIAAAVFGLFYGYIGVQTLIRGDGKLATFFFVFGFGGIVLGLALFSVWRQLVRKAREG